MRASSNTIFSFVVDTAVTADVIVHFASIGQA